MTAGVAWAAWAGSAGWGPWATPVGWLLGGASLVLVPGGRPARHGRPAAARARGIEGRGGPAFAAALPSVAAAAVAVACVAVGGPVAGLLVALVAGPLTWQLARRLQARPRAGPADDALPLTLDLAAAGLRTGGPLSEALARAAPAAGHAAGTELTRVAGLLRLGADAPQAWAVAAQGPLAPVVPVAVRSAASGIRLADALEGLAAELRAQGRAAGTQRAQRAGVRALGPLAACFLPSFVCLGVVPVVVGIARSALQLAP